MTTADNNNGGLFSDKGMDEQLKEIGLGGSSKRPKENYTYKAPKKPSRWKVIRVYLVFALIVGSVIGGVCCFIFKPRVSIDSKKKLEFVLSPQYCEREFTLKSNKSHLVFVADEPWATGQITDNLLKIKVEENNTGKERMNILGVKAKRAKATIVLRQMPHVSYLNVEKDVLIEALGGEKTIKVSTDAFDMEVGVCPSWCKATVDDKQIVLDCENNTDDFVREGQIEIIADTAHAVLNIKQAGLRGAKTEEESRADFIQKHYTGDLKDGVPHGKGVMNYPDGGTYDGSFVDGKQQGKGKYVWPNGDVYEGDWLNDKVSGKGTMKYANGDVYEGEWMNNKISGKGKMKYANGNVYEGEWRNSARTGAGTFKYLDGSVYKGMWKDGSENGKGVLKYSNGDVYDGEWVNGKKQGKGKVKFADGSTYEGDWQKDVFHGYGKMKYADGSVYEGEFKEGYKYGKGKMKWADRDVYDGEWMNDDLNGRGTYKYADGSVYEGEFKDGLKQGKGKQKWANGTIYEGDWLNDNVSGQGTMKYVNGDVYEGEFKEGERHGKGTYTYADGKVKKGVWKEGEYKSWSIW